MIEQCIYSRADNNHYNANHQRVYMGYGRMAYSAGFDRVGAYLDQNVSTYPNSIPDAQGMLPPVMSMYEVDTDEGRVHVLQQVVPLGLDRGRQFHIGHMYAATDEQSIKTMVTKPLGWMQLNYQSVQREPIDYPVNASQAMPLAVKFNPGTLSEVLKYFNMTPACFELLLCSLFEVRKYDAIFSLVLFDDRRSGYYDWIRRLIVHIYTFLPIEMRRRIGFETWFTGRLMAGAVNLGFASMRCFRRQDNHCTLQIDTSTVFDVTHCAIFSGNGYLCIPNEEISINFNVKSSYRTFIHSWINQALLPQKCAETENKMNQYWLLFDGTPEGSGACSLNDFDNLIIYDQMLRGAYFPDKNDLPAFASKFCGAMGVYGQKLLASRLNAMLSTTSIDDSLIDNYCELLDVDRYGMDIFQCVAALLKDSLKSINVDIQRLDTLLRMSRRGLLPLDQMTLTALLRHAKPGVDCWSDTRFMLHVLTMDASDRLSPEGRSVALNRAIGFLPSVFLPDENTELVLGDAERLDEPERSAFVFACVSHMKPSVVWLQSRMEPLLRAIPDPSVHGSCVNLTARAVEQCDLDVESCLELLQLSCLLFSQDEAMMIAPGLVTRCDLAHAGLKDIMYVLDVLGNVSQEFSLPDSVLAAALDAVLQNATLSVSERVKITINLIRDGLSADSLIAFLKEQRQAELFSQGDFEALCEIFPTVPEAIVPFIVDVMPHSLRALAVDRQTLDALLKALTFLPDPVQQDMLDLLLTRIADQPSRDSYSMLAAVLTAFPPREALVPAACKALRSAEIIGGDAWTLRHLLAIVDHYGDWASTFLPHWQRLLETLPQIEEGEVEQLMTLLTVIQHVGEKYPDYAAAAARRLLQDIAQQNFSVSTGLTLINDMSQIIDATVSEAVCTIFEHIDCSNDEGANAMLAALLDLVERLPADAPVQMCYDRMTAVLENTAVEGTRLRTCLERCASGAILPGEEFIRTAIRSVNRCQSTPIEQMMTLAACEAIDQSLSDKPVRTQMTAIVQSGSLTLDDAMRWQQETHYTNAQLHRNLLIEMLGHVSINAGLSPARSVLWMLRNMDSNDSELRTASDALYHRAMGELRLDDIGPVADALRTSRRPDADELLATAVSALDSTRRSSRNLSKVNEIMCWPDIQKNWPLTRAALEKSAEALADQLTIPELIEMAEQYRDRKIVDLLIEILMQKALPNNDAQTGNATQFYFRFGIRANCETILDICHRVFLLFEDEKKARQTIVQLLDWIQSDDIADLPAFLDKLLFICVDSAPVEDLIKGEDRREQLKNAIDEEIASDDTEFSATLRGLLLCALQDNRLKLDETPESDIRLTSWLVAFPANGLDLNGTECAAMLDALKSSRYLTQGDKIETLYALTATHSESILQRVKAYIIDNTVRRARNSLRSGKLNFSRWQQFGKPIVNTAARVDILAQSISVLDREGGNVLQKYLESLLSAIRQSYAKHYNSESKNNVIEPRVYGQQMLIRLSALAKAIEERADKDKLSWNAEKNTLTQFCQNHLNTYLKDFGLMAEILGSADQDPLINPKGLTLLMNWVFPLWKIPDGSVNFLRSYRNVCCNDGLKKAMKALSGTESEPYKHYLSWRLQALAYWCIHLTTRDAKDTQTLLTFLGIIEKYEILCGFWKLFDNCNGDPFWEHMRRECLDTICYRYYHQQRLGGRLGFALLFPKELMARDGLWEEASVETIFLRLMSFRNNDVHNKQKGYESELQRLQSSLPVEKYEELNNILKMSTGRVIIRKAYEESPTIYI